MTKNRPVRGGDLQTMSRQHGGFLGFLGKLFGLGASDMQKQMQDPVKQQMMMQRGGFPWALACLSILPMLMGKGEEDGIQRQMKTTRDPIMQRGGLSTPPALLSKGLPLLKSTGLPLAMGALASVGDNVVDKVFGKGRKCGSAVERTGGSLSSSSSSSSRNMLRGKRSNQKQYRKMGNTRRKGKAPLTKRPRKIKTKNRQSGLLNIKTRRHVRPKNNTSSSSFLRKGKRVVRNHLAAAGRSLFEKAKSKVGSTAKRTGKSMMNSLQQDTPFAKKIRQSLNMSASSPLPRPSSNTTRTSSHIQNSFNL